MLTLKSAPTLHPAGEVGKFTQKEMYCVVWWWEREAWFGRKGVFNHSKDKIWISTTEKIEFSEKRSTN